jgi:NAD(P)-dependent dehydrogenase (short-subunit alcohol dehydrogenase family)
VQILWDLQVLCIPADVTKDVDMEAAVKRCVAELGDVNIAVINAGVQSVDSAITGDVSKMDAVLEVNLSAPVHLTRTLLPYLVKPGLDFASVRRVPSGTGEFEPPPPGSRAIGSSLIYISSRIAAQYAMSPGHAAYIASKAGLAGFADGVWAEVRQMGVRVCTIYPGLVSTDMGTAFTKDFGAIVNRSVALLLFFVSPPLARLPLVCQEDEAGRVLATK